MTRKTAPAGRRREVEGLSPAVLRWARQQTNSTVADVATRLGVDSSVITGWEAGTSAPTYAELERLAYDILKRPLALFFFPEPPEEAGPEESFRTLPDFELEKLAASTRLAVRRARADQLALAELFGGDAPSPNPLLRTVRADPRTPVARAATAVRRAIGVPLDRQLAWKSMRQALDEWRGAFEEAGLFVFKTSLDQRSVSGFSLNGSTYPVVVLNNSTSLTRQIFTLAHEVGHLLAHTGGVTVTDDRFVEALRGESHDIEVFCNRFASELLVPSDDFSARVGDERPNDEFIAALADLYRVSREVILRRFLDLRRVTKSTYEEKARAWASDYERHAETASGGDFYRTRVSYLSPRLLREVMSRYSRGTIDTSQAADYLGVKPSHIPGIEEIALQKVRA